MTPKEKAEELIGIYKNLHGHPTEQYLDSEDAKMCALTAVDELIKATETVWFLDGNYWQEVKQELEKL